MNATGQRSFEQPPKKELLVSKGWLQAVAMVVLFGFFVMGLLAYRTYAGEAPIPARTVSPDQKLLFTRQDILGGQQIFLKNGLMEYGSIFGHGACLGPDYTADYLRRSATMVATTYRQQNSDRSKQATIDEFQTNRFDPHTDTLVFSAAQANAFRDLVPYYTKYFAEPTTRYGLRPGAISDPGQARQLTAFFAWSAWVSAALRPGHNYSYTNNWPPEPLVNNTVTADNIVWSVLTLIVLFGGIGALFTAFGRWNVLGWHGREHNSAAEVIPLTFLTVEAWSFLQLGARQEARSRTEFPHYWAVMFLVSVGSWNFLGAGVFGFLINLPVVSYYEIGTALTTNHGHAAMMGVMECWR